MDEWVTKAVDFLLQNPNASIQVQPQVQGGEKIYHFLVLQDVTRKKDRCRSVEVLTDGLLREKANYSYQTWYRTDSTCNYIS